jgi:uncharacterized repeat protein (TIGR01451 family)
MRLRLGKPTRLLRNQSLSSFLSLTLSTVLVLLPVWPARAASNVAGPDSMLSAPAREFAPRAAVVSPLAPSLTATKTDSFSDPDGDGKAEPGQTITYTVTVTNNGPDDATNVQFTDTVDPNTTLVPGSVTTQPIAADDSYNVLGNVRIQPNAAGGLLANDCDPDNGGPCSSAGLTASGPSASAQGGDVTVNANGSFSYNPPAGFEGADSFTYTVTDPTGSTDTATVNLTVNEVVWFVDNTAAPGGDGRLTNPYNSLAPLGGTDLDEPFDFIFVYEGSGAYNGGIVLEDNQRLIGQGTSLDAALSTFGVTAPAHSDPRPAATSRPVLANSGGHVITLASNNAVLHLDASATAASSAAIFGGGVSGGTVSNVGASAATGASGVSLLNHGGLFGMADSTVTANSTAAAVSLVGGSTALTFSNTDVSQSGGGRAVDIQNRTGGAVSFDAASSVAATNSTVDAVSLLSNSGTITFAGPVTLNTSGARGLVADSGNVNLTSSGNTVSATGAAAVDIENLAANISFATTFSTNSTGRGLRVDNVSGAASFGNTAVNNSANTGVLLTDNSAAVSFSDLDIAPNAGARALHAVNNTGAITSTSGVVATSGVTAVEIVGTSAASRTPLNVTLTTVTAAGTLTAAGIILTNTSAAGSPGGFGVTGIGTTDGSGGAITATAAGVDAVALTDAERVALRNFDLGDAAAANNEQPNTQVSIGDDAISITRVTPGAGGTYGLDLDNVKIADTAGHGINGAGGGNVGLRFAGGEIINAGDDLALTNESAMHFGSGSPSADQITGVVTITNSTFSGFTGYGFSVENAGNGTLNMTVSGSTYQNNDSTGSGDSGIQLIIDGGSGGAPTANLHVLNTNFTNIDLDGVEVIIDPGGVGNVTIDGGTTNSPNGDNAFHLVSGSQDPDDTESLTALVQNVTVNAMRGSLILMRSGAGAYHATIQNSTLNSGDTDDGGGAHIGRGIEFLMDADNIAGEVITAKVKIHNVTLNNIGVDGIFVSSNEVVAGSTADVTITNSTVGTAAAPVGRSNTGEGIEIIARDPLVMNLSVQNNNIFTRGTSTTSEASDFDSETTATLNATIVGNTFQNGVGATANSLDINTEAATASICLDLRTNSAVGGSGANYQLGAVAGSVFNFERAGTGAVTAAEVQGQQTSGTVTVTGTVNKNNGANCAEPTDPNAPALPTFVSLNTPAENGANVQLAAADAAPAQPNAPAGSSALSAFAEGLRKIPQGLAHSVGGQLLGLGLGDETPQAVAAPAPLAVSGETVNITIGTLRAGDSVTITFQVTVADPFPANVNPPQVSNQGTVTADGGISVLTDDPSEPGGADPTVTPILTPPTISVNDATVAEPATGSTNMSFTVTLSHAYTQNVSVNFTTANGGANPATPGTDYTTTSGTVVFVPGETVQTINVPVLADGTAAEGDEHFLVNLNTPSNGTLNDGSALGTITDESVASQLIISELRTNGPNGANDDFVELLNTTDADITVVASDGSGSGWAVVEMGADCNATPVVVGVIPEGTIIPARGNYLFTGSAYSLSGYPAGNGTTATGDATLSADIELNHNVGLFSTASLASISTVNRLDAVGFGTNTGGNCDLLREGNTLPPTTGFAVDYSFVRKVDKGLTVDTTDNAADFIVVDTNGTLLGGNAQHHGAPGPENLSSPRGPVPCSATAGAAKFGRDLIDPGVSVASAPNVARDNTSDPPNNSTFGTIDFRRTWTNNTGAPVSRLRFRITDITTFPAPSGTADLRARSSAPIVVSTTAGNKTVLGTTLETPPFQPNGGGINASLSAGTVTLATPLANGASVNLRFLFGIQQTGDYDIAIVLESLPGSGKDFWKLSGHTETGGHTDGGCNKPPVADAGDDQTLECSAGQATATLDGSGSTDPDGDTPLTFEWFEGANPLGTGQSINVPFPTGSHTVTLKVTDPSGDSSTDTVIINVVDTTAPVVTAPPDVTVYTGPGATSCSATVSDAQLGTATALDGCEGSLTPQRTGVPAGNVFPIGTTQVTYTATDASGNIGSDVQNVTVVDNTPPVVTPPANITTTADPNSCSATVNPGMATATDNCSVQSINGTRSDNQPLNAPYPVGTTVITWTATDASGNQATAQQTVTVVDSQAPTLTSSVSVTTMGPPFNHALINVGLSATASDNCGSVGPFQVFVYSDEDDGPAPHSPDATNIGIGSLRLRRERNGGSDGRVYLVVVKVADASGNVSSSCNTVTVPLSNSAGDQTAVNAQAAAASSFCSANNGSAPAGYFVVGP